MLALICLRSDHCSCEDCSKQQNIQMDFFWGGKKPKQTDLPIVTNISFFFFFFCCKIILQVFQVSTARVSPAAFP